MKTLMASSIAAGLLVALAGCGGGEENNAAVADADNVLNEILVPNQSAEPLTPVNGNASTELVEPAADEAASAPPSPKAAPKTAPKPAPVKPAEKVEPVDPHAGHDMNNMSH